MSRSTFRLPRSAAGWPSISGAITRAGWKRTRCAVLICWPVGRRVEAFSCWVGWRGVTPVWSCALRRRVTRSPATAWNTIVSRPLGHSVLRATSRTRDGCCRTRAVRRFWGIARLPFRSIRPWTGPTGRWSRRATGTAPASIRSVTTITVIRTRRGVPIAPWRTPTCWNFRSAPRGSGVATCRRQGRILSVPAVCGQP